MYARSAEFEIVAGLVEQHIPIYEPEQWDPIVAAETGRGSCFVKNVYGAIILDIMSTGNAKTAIQWGDAQHPQESAGMIHGLTVKKPGHSTLLIATRNTLKIRALSFNETSRRKTAWEIYDFNSPDEEPMVEVQGKVIVPTAIGLAAGIHAYTWYQAGKKYTEKLGIYDSCYHTLSEQDIFSIVKENVKAQPIQREIPRSS